MVRVHNHHTRGEIARMREKDNAAGPEWVPLSSSVGERDAAAPYEALRCDAIVAISKGSTRPRYFTVFLLPQSVSREWLDGGARTESTKYKQQEGGLLSAKIGCRGRQWVEGGIWVSYWADPI
jgi:hypothetical protein